MTGALIRVNFRVAVWITILGAALILVFMDPGDPNVDVFRGRGALKLAGLSVFQLMGWFWWYRHDEGQGMAAAVALGLSGGVVALLLLPQVSDGRMNLVLMALLAYLSVSHALYAVWGWRLRPRSALEL